jgi:hypothetical protein
MTRMQARDLPRGPTLCNLEKPCVYRENGICDMPWINKGNGDAACHKMGNRAIYEKLELPANAGGKPRE